MSRLGAAHELGRATGRLEEANKQLRETVRSTALAVATAFMDSLARDSMLEFTEPTLPDSLEGLPFLEDVQAGDQVQPWYRVRGSSLFVALVRGMWRNELRVFRADGSRVAEWDELQRRELCGEPVFHALQRAPDMIRSLG